MVMADAEAELGRATINAKATPAIQDADAEFFTAPPENGVE
jgi:hypothetical protein